MSKFVAQKTSTITGIDHNSEVISALLYQVRLNSHIILGADRVICIFMEISGKPALSYGQLIGHDISSH